MPKKKPIETTEEAKLLIDTPAPVKAANPVEEYFNSRMQSLGIDSSNNSIEILQTEPGTLKNVLVKHSIFTLSDKGIDILAYTLDRLLITYSKEGSRWKNQTYRITRLYEPHEKKDGSIIKYLMPKGEPVVPFFPPQLVAKFEKKIKSEVLYLTEGYFKAYKACMHGIDCVGLPSITCLKDRETGELHGDIKRLITACGYERLVWLTDGDCRNLTGKELQWKETVDGKVQDVVPNLSLRPHGFFSSVSTFYDLTSKLDNVQRYFAHIDSDNLEGNPKGLDDLLCALPEETKAIAKEFNSFDKKREQLTYTFRIEITFGTSRVRKYFFLDDVNNFYSFHVEKRPEIKDREFRYYGSIYQYNDKEHRCLVKIPKDASSYIRVGDTYYEKQRVPDHLGNYYDILDARDKATIKDDFGNDIFKHIQKYKGFVNIPNHVNFQPVIDSFYNRYSPLPHELEEGDYSNSIDFLKHIFGEDKIELSPGHEIERWEMGLDYLTILFRYPTQILPILCPVSEERQTGKTKFLEWLCILFAENAIVIGNQDLENKFNRHWNGKLIIGVDETKIDKLIVLERVKALSTSSFTIDEGKGKDQKKVPFFGKFVLNSNNVRNFAYIDEKEIRFWIIEVPTVKKRNVDLLETLREEANAFLSFLSRREIVCPRRERHWFETRLLRTQALQNIMDNSKPTVEKLLRIALEDLFNATEYLVINMPMHAIVKDLLKGKFAPNYVTECLHKMGYKSKPSYRISYPRLVEKETANGISIEAISMQWHGTYYSFERNDFADGDPVDTGTGIIPPTPKNAIQAVQANAFVSNDSINDTIVLDQRKYIKVGSIFKEKIAKNFYEVTTPATIQRLQELWEQQNK